VSFAFLLQKMVIAFGIPGLLLLLAAVGAEDGDESPVGGILSSVGKVTSMLTPFLPPEVRGIASAASGVLQAEANRKRGLVDFVPDGSDYGWICVCPSKYELELAIKSGSAAAPDKCAGDIKMGCRPSQVLPP
jgi:hypothetical protein